MDSVEANELWHELIKEATRISEAYQMFEMRQRLNPHHPEEHKKEERERLERNLSVRFLALKELYVRNREPLLQIADQGLEAKWRKAFIHDMEEAIQHDMENIVLT